MAITKIICIGEEQSGNPAKHLGNALDYIMNPDKTEECVLVGGVNCLPETAYEQMVQTKELFGKTDKRQGYHVIISFPPGEGTDEEAFEVTKRFTKEYFGEKYEAVYAIHTDKEHKHGHIIVNSVGFQDGIKYVYRPGEWKRKMQPLTNKLCDEYNLSIMPAEYAKNPVNLSRKQWEYEQSFKEMILQDAKFCAQCAGSLEHFEFLMKRIGYELKSGEYLTVKMPGRKLYHKLEKMDDMFLKENFKYYWHAEQKGIAKFYTSNPQYVKRFYMSGIQKRFYGKMYRLRMIECKRFDVGSAYFAKELQRFGELQKEYLFLCRNNVESLEGLLDYHKEQSVKLDEIDHKQDNIYKKRSVLKRQCKTPEGAREFQKYYLNSSVELDFLKVEKRECKENMRMAADCINEKLNTAIDIIPDNVVIPTTTFIDAPDYQEIGEKDMAEVVAEDAIVDNGEVENIDITDTIDINVPSISVTDDVELPDDHTAKSKYSAEQFEELQESRKVGAEAYFQKHVDEICSNIFKQNSDYQSLSFSSKAEIFGFDIDDNETNLNVYMEVMNKLGIQQSFDEMFEDYQGIYDVGMTRDAGITRDAGGKVIDRGR